MFPRATAGQFIITAISVKLATASSGITAEKRRCDFLASRAKQLKVEYANFVGNNAKDGGAISNVSDYGVSVKSSRFENNSAQYGGAISDWVSESDMSVADSDFIANKGALGGAVAVWDTAANKVLISGSAFEHNESEHGGAILIVETA